MMVKYKNIDEPKPDDNGVIFRVNQENSSSASDNLQVLKIIDITLMKYLTVLGLILIQSQENYGILKMDRNMVMKLILLNQGLIADGVRCKVHGH